MPLTITTQLAVLMPSLVKAAGLGPAMFALCLGMGLAVLAIWSVVIITQRVVRLCRRRPLAPATRGKQWRDRVVLLLTLLAVGCLAYSAMEPYWLEVAHVEVPCAKLPTGAKPIRIVHFSDTHSEARARLEYKLPALIAEQEPDIICFTGDSLNDMTGQQHFQTLMMELTQIAPVYVVQGNWDTRRPLSKTELYGDAPVHLLNARAERLMIDGQPIWLVGTPEYNPNINRALTNVNTDEPVVLLHHVPSIILDLPGRGVDLCLSGHTHGGQIALPFYGALTTLTSTGKRFERGLYLHEGVALYVNRGIGLEGGRAPRIRFFARPELTVIDLVPTE